MRNGVAGTSGLANHDLPLFKSDIAAKRNDPALLTRKMAETTPFDSVQVRCRGSYRN
jgi:hypothetical protein